MTRHQPRRKRPPANASNPGASMQSACDLERKFFAVLSAVREAGAHRASDAKLAQRYGLSAEEISHPRVLRERLLQVAADSLPGTSQGIDLPVLARHLELRRAADGLDTDLASEVVALLREATRKTSDWVLPAFDGHLRAWEEAVYAIVCLRRRSRHTSHSQDVRMNGVAESVCALRTLGHKIKIRDGKVDFQPWESLFVSQLEQDVRRAGGQAVAEAVFRALSTRYSRSQGYFHITRSAGTVPMDVPRPGPPNGFLLNLAAKHFNAFSASQFPDELGDLFGRAEHYGRVRDLAPSSVWEVYNRDLRTILPLLRELAAFDTLYQVPQFRLRDAGQAIAHLFDWATSEAAAGAWGADVADVCRLIDSLDVALKDEVGPACFTVTDFSAVLSSEHASRTLVSFSHQDGAANAAFGGPLQTEHVDAWTRPFFGDGRRFTILDGRVAGNAFIECAASLMRRVDAATYTRMGLALERWMRAEFRRRGVAVHAGRYRSSIGDGECDVVVQTDDVVVFFELKRKSLTPRSRSADGWALLRDLQHAFLEPQGQLGRHELALYRDGSLELSDGTRIVRGDREVERVAVTLFDYGAFHTRDVSVQLLDLLAGAVVESPEALPEQVKGINRLLQTLGDQARELQVLKGTDRPHFGCWFLGVPQLLVLLDNVDSNAAFWHELKRTRHVSLGRLSWFSEYEYMRNASETAKLADAVSRKKAIIVGG